ncbi:MAG: hypothetical protein LBJ67_08905 [Planctomycetaceae bacterium]|jgi:hypothetical protein|nr:hypothetical protein [Planctomycetaceae bacterium]
MKNIFLNIAVCLSLFLPIPFDNAVVAQDKTEKQAMEQFYKMAVDYYSSEDRFGIEKFGFEKESQVVEQAGKAAAQETIQQNTELQFQAPHSPPKKPAMGRFYKMPVGTDTIGKQPSASSSSPSANSSSASSSSSPNYIPTEASEITQYVPINTSYSFYDEYSVNGCGAEGGGFKPPDKIRVIYSYAGYTPFRIMNNEIATELAVLNAAIGREFVPTWIAPPRPNGKIFEVEIFDLAEIACNPHDLEYYTLPKEEADLNFYNRLLDAGVPPFIALVYYESVKHGGHAAYNEAQRRVRERENAHDHIHFFADDGSYNVGYFEDGIHEIEKSNNAVALGGEYEVEIMKKIAEKVSHYWLLEEYNNRLLKGHKYGGGYDNTSHNCQHFADALRIAYYVHYDTREYGKICDKWSESNDLSLSKIQQEERRKTEDTMYRDYKRKLTKMDLSGCSKELQEFHKKNILLHESWTESNYEKYVDAWTKMNEKYGPIPYSIDSD